MYEHKKQPLASKAVYYSRLRKNLIYSISLLVISAVIGTAGFRFFAPAHYSWYDCFHNASMLLSGMGPIIIDFETNAGKVFSSVYAIFSGVAFITNVGVLTAPVVHRFFHKLHVEEE